MKVKDIIKIIDGEILCGNDETECDNFVRDSREVKEGDVFVALKGENFDGNNFCKEAIQNGAKVCIVSRDVTEEIKESENSQNRDNGEIKKSENSQNKDDEKTSSAVTIVKVKDTLKALQEIATYKRMQYNIPVVAVTGSVGKTSTKDLIAGVISQKYNTLKTKGNFNNEIGLPLTILGLKDEEAMVVEMGMNHFGEISKLTNIAKPTVAVITNIGTAHIGNLGSRENILKAKLEILEGLQGNTVVINNDNDLLNKWAKENHDKYNIITYGIVNDSDYMAKNIEAFEDKSEYEIYISNKNKNGLDGKTIVVPVGGEHFILNSLCAIAVGEYLEVPLEKIIQGVANFELTKKRMEVLKSKCGATIINDTYNANYDSMKAAITYLKEIKGRRKIAVLGDMLELGDFSKELHEKIGNEIDENIDVLITVGNEAKYIAKNAKAKEIFEYDSNKDAINRIKNIINQNDAILLKASNGMRFFDIASSIQEF